ncbi:MAG: FkbM family methyltransferase [Rubrivivax sp.]|nr:FkbM family methyltransferase [Rubrivivax sp.]
MGLLASIYRRLGWRRGSGIGTLSVGVGAGLRLDPSTSNPDYATGANELPVQQALAQHLSSGGVFYDVGANIGFLTLIGARLVGPAGRVLAFEPVPRNAAAIRRNAALNGFATIQVIEKALTRRSGIGELALAAYAGGAVLAEVDTPPDSAGTLSVELASIDDLVELSGYPAPGFVKIDVEGAELDVLEGMERTAARCRPVILCEVDDAEPAGLARKQQAIEQWLAAHGYRFSELPPSYEGIRWLVKHLIAVPRTD